MGVGVGDKFISLGDRFIVADKGFISLGDKVVD